MSRPAPPVDFDPYAALAERQVERTSRSAARRLAAVKDTAKTAVRTLQSTAKRSVEREKARIVLVRTTAARKKEQSRRARSAATITTPVTKRDSARVHHSQTKAKVKAKTRVRRIERRTRIVVTRPARGMSSVIAFARSQIGKSYRRGAEGPFSFDCSGFTKRAYARAGLYLPHSSGAQAARARSVSRSQARAGDLVVGPGHVGIYMGNGMMIDAGNSRVGVTFRPLYGGLRIERF